MDHYDELGIAPDASAGEIHRAYKRLAKQFHPDTWSTDVQRRWAETQMKRLNEIFETLSNPDRKARYDHVLQDFSMRRLAEDRRAIESYMARRRGRKAAWAIVALTGLAGIAGAIYFGFEPSDRPDSPVRVEASEPSKDRISTSPTSAVGRPAQAPKSSVAQTPAGTEDHPTPKLEVARQIESPPDISQIPPVPPLEAELAPMPEPPLVHTSRNPFAGTWIFSPSRAPKSHLPFAAEYVEVSLEVLNQKVTGRFQGRYNVRTSTLPPRVHFQFEGEEDRLGAGLPWGAENGSGGLIKFHLLSNNELEVGWYTTRFAPSPALTSGTAILRRDPAEH
jgi:curved DNA-binding protein CbpA